MSETTPERAAVLGRRGEAETIRARTSLAEGRHAEALAAVRRARRLRPAQEAPALALAEVDALLGLFRHREALAVATRALRRPPEETDVEARLRLVRGHGLWLTGAAALAHGELRKAALRATTPLTRARVLEGQADQASRAQDHPAAMAHLDQAERIYVSAGCAAGEVRVLERRGAALRRAGQLEQALRVQEGRIARASALARPDAVAMAEADRGILLGRLGRWEEARRELERAAARLHERGDARETTVAGVALAEVDVASGDLGRAAGVLERVRDFHAERGNTRALADALLLMAELHLAAGRAEAAERIAVEALDLYRILQDGEGECGSRERRVHALVALGRPSEAAREGRRAWRAAAASPGELSARVLLALGRALLRLDRREAAAAFERARALAVGQTGPAAAAELGLALARGGETDGHDVRQALARLEAWGDRRLLGRALADVRDVRGAREHGLVAEGAAAALPRVPMLSAAVDAAAAVLGEEAPRARWTAVLGAVRTVLPWYEAAWSGADGPWGLAPGAGDPRPLGEEDLAWAVAHAGVGPRVVDLTAPPWREHPCRVRHGLSRALLVPAPGAAWAYVAFREGDGVGPDDAGLAVLAEFVRLLSLREGDAGGSGAGEHEPDADAAEGAEAVDGVDGLIGRCAAMRELARTVARVASSDLVVHVSGETGTGKERVASALHARSGRTGRFVAVNASSLSDELFESEMFGHVRGAFTGAVADREGHVTAATGGTLFLDEVADLSKRAQGKLLRFVETREYCRVGDPRVHKADVRLVTAANVPLEKRLRPDLIFRLTDVVLGLPPLRERGEDVWRLARAFLRRHGPARGLLPAVTPAARRAIESFAWPGNVRELQSVIKRAIVLAAGRPISPEHLCLPAEAPASGASRSLRDAVLACERRHIAEVLALNAGNRARTAVVLGLTRQGLVAKMARLGIG